jgi:hypothetical protein
MTQPSRRGFILEVKRASRANEAAALEAARPLVEAAIEQIKAEYTKGGCNETTI